MARVCECCGQSLPPRLKSKARLSVLQRIILERVHRAGINGILSTSLFDYVYADDPDGGPLTGMKALHVRIYHINQKISLDGLRIRAPTGGMGGHTNYVLEKVASSNVKNNQGRIGKTDSRSTHQGSARN